MSICLLRIGDGRDEVHERSWASAKEALSFDHLVTVDDPDHALGFAGAIAEGWRQVRETGAEWCFHLELDFLIHGEVPLGRMIAVLKRHPYLAQLVLLRQPVNDQERDAGGIIPAWPAEYHQRSEDGEMWTEHRLFWSTNPSLYSTRWCSWGWPQQTGSEAAWWGRLGADPAARCAFWGAKFDPPLCEHIGERAGVGY